MTLTLRQEIEAEARTWLGTPYQHQARVKGVGCDCAGLPIGVARALGLIAPDFDVTGYARQPDGTSLIDHCERWMTRVELVDMAVGDVIVLRFDRDPQHLGMVVSHRHGLGMLHALGTADGKGRVVEHRLDATTLDRFVAAFRLPGVPA